MSHKYKFKCYGNKIKVGPWDSSVGKGKSYDLNSIPEIHMVGKKEPTPKSCPLPSACVL